MRITNKQLHDLYVGLHKVGNLNGVKFSYIVSRNIAMIKSDVLALAKAQNATEEYKLYEKDRLELIEKHAVKKDGKFQFKKENGAEVYVLTDENKYLEALVSVQAKHNEAIVLREEQTEDFNLLMNEEVEINIHRLPVEHIPEAITAIQMAGILLVVDEDKAV